MRCFLWILCFNFHKMLLTPSCGTRRGSNPRQSYSCYSGERGGARGELNLQRGNWVLSRYHVITLQYSTTAGLAAISPVDILHVHKYLVTCSKPLKIWHNPRFCWRTKPSQFYLLDVLIVSIVWCAYSHMVLTVCIAIILCRPHYGNAVTSDNVTKWRRDIIRPQEILRPGTKHWRLCALRQSSGV